jgi:hypothetical protein
MKTVDRIERSVSLKKSDVLLRAEYDSFGSEAQVSRALKELVERGKLVKLGRGVYAKAKPSVLTGKAIPIKPLESLAPEALKKLGIQTTQTQQVEDYNSGKSTQIPAGIVFKVARRRITRKLGFNGKTVKFELA